MPIHVDLHPAVPHVMVYRFYSPWTRQDLFEAFDREQYLSQVIPTGQTYDVVVDVRWVRAPVPGLYLRHLQSIAERKPANSHSLWIVCRPEMNLKSLLDKALQPFPRLRAHTHFVANMREALHGIQ
jgi:hypothetical protein